MIDLAATSDDDLIHRWDVPTSPNTTVSLEAYPGRAIVFVGANGAGKSALAWFIRRGIPVDQAVHIRSNRLLYFDTAGPSQGPAQRPRLAQNLASGAAAVEGIWIDNVGHNDIDLVLLDLVAEVNRRNAQVASLVDEATDLQYVRSKSDESPVEALNRIVRAVGFPFEIGLTSESTFEVKRKSGERYPIFQMSDGERSALHLAGKVLTAPKRSVITLDEPERHLHRSISAPLIDAILAERGDCHVVLFTHDLDLAASLRRDRSQVWVVASCERSAAGQPLAWTMHDAGLIDGFDEGTRRAILGGRSRLLFVEGGEGSLDVRVYRALLPTVSVHPVGGCEEVIRNSKGLRASERHHWLQPGGVIDQDARSQDEITSLKRAGVQVLPYSEVENVLFAPEMIEVIAHLQGDLLGRSGPELASLAVADAFNFLDANSRCVEAMATTVALKRATRQTAAQAPSVDQVRSGENFSLTIANEYAGILARLADVVRRRDYAELIRSYPIRDSGIMKRISSTLLFQSPRHYEDFAIVRLRHGEPSAVASGLRALLGEPTLESHAATDG
jgi:energy-coupling factor transporter ATP-binding protein EcfA2